MDYKGGNIYLGGHDKDMLANALVAHIKHISSLRDQCLEVGLSGYDFNWQIANYRALLERLGE